MEEIIKELQALQNYLNWADEKTMRAYLAKLSATDIEAIKYAIYTIKNLTEQ